MPKIEIFWDVALCVHIQPLSVQAEYHSSMNSCPLMIHTHLCLNAILAYGRKWDFFFDIGVIGQKIFSCFLFVVKSLSLRPVTLRPTFELQPFGVEFVVDKLELEQISLRVLRVCAVSTIPPVLRKHLHLQSLP